MSKEEFKFKEDFSVKPNIVYLVTMVRIASVDSPHQYNLGVYSSYLIAKQIGDVEVTKRALKYKCFISPMIMDKEPDREDIEYQYHISCGQTYTKPVDIIEKEVNSVTRGGSLSASSDMRDHCND